MYLLLENKKVDITPLIGTLGWKNSLGALGTEVTFNVARNYHDKEISRLDLIKVGSKILLMNKEDEIFRGIVVDRGTELFQRSIVALDFAFYLNESKIIKQFRRANASTAIEQLLNQFKVPIGHIVKISTMITKIYKDNTIAEIIKDILKQATEETGVKYRLEMRAGKVYIILYEKLKIKAFYSPSDNLYLFDVTKALGRISKKESMRPMRNSIVVETNGKQSFIVSDQEGIDEYGLLQDVITIDDKNKAQQRNIAKNKLRTENKIAEDIDIEVLGSDLLNSGRILEVNEPVFELEGEYLIKACMHTYQNSIHKAALTLERYEDGL